MKKLLILGICATVLNPSLKAREASGQAAAYLKFGVDARILGLGGAGTATSQDVNATYWNPAGIAHLDHREAAAMHTSLSLDRNYNYVGYAAPVNDRWRVGVGYHRFSVDGIPETRIHSRDVDGNGQLDDPILSGETDGNPLAGGRATAPVRIFSYFEDAEENFTLSVAREFDQRLAVGASVKFFNQDLFTESADGIGLDFGLQYKAAKRVTLGAAVKDVGSELEWSTGRTDEIPVSASVGGAFHVRHDMNIAVDVMKREHEKTALRLGVEKWFMERYGLRMGTNEGEFTAGASAKVDDWSFDYAYNDQDLGNVQRISAKRRF